ncbi:hypothetical protein MTX78_08290 [Hymenobacter tibetensis]|uniref:Uncharacterized protein n=1 Tax=Hymenobacter tibetensis TaxID=497967 RepID=A0ABY4D3H7_9BACT|nr:hypothetical protein [Hymenobacter tibetensis]UOG76587.1 hypothetical protein MTX78_08290 [Hymenobacter tibetensis]
MKTTLFVAALLAFLLGNLPQALAQASPAQATPPQDTAKARERMKKDQKKSADGKYMLNPKKAKGKTKSVKTVNGQ